MIPIDTLSIPGVKVTFDLNGTFFGTGDDEASIIFIQNSVWYSANIAIYGTNGQDGEQEVTIPLTAFRKVGDTELLDLESDASNFHVRFWNSGSFTVDITSVQLLGSDSGGSGTYTYDLNGNMTSDGVKCYAYNEANQLKTVTDCDTEDTIAEYIYDYNGLRIIKKNYASDTLANTVTSWTESYETKVIVGGGTEETAYYYANGELIAKRTPGDDLIFYHNDHLHSASVLSDESGNVVEETSYDPWGKVVEGGTASKFLYTGQEHDGETGLNYYNARYYNPDIMHFTQPDPLVQNIYDPQTLNRYAYVRNNPLRYTDPSGHFFGTILGIINAFNTIKSVISNAKPATPPTSSAKLPNNIPNGPLNKSGSINISSQSSGSVMGSGSFSSGSITPVSPAESFNPTTLLPARGNLDINYSSRLKGPFGGSVGVQMNKQGYMLYGGVGLITPGKGLSANYSPNDPVPHSTSYNLGGNIYKNVGLNLSWPYPNDNFSPFAADKSVGVVYPRGYSFMVNQTFSFHAWNDMSGYKFIQTVE